jgi:hypothetical protein
MIFPLVLRSDASQGPHLPTINRNISLMINHSKQNCANHDFVKKGADPNLLRSCDYARVLVAKASENGGHQRPPRQTREQVIAP